MPVPRASSWNRHCRRSLPLPTQRHTQCRAQAGLGGVPSPTSRHLPKSWSKFRASKGAGPGKGRDPFAWLSKCCVIFAAPLFGRHSSIYFMTEEIAPRVPAPRLPTVSHCEFLGVPNWAPWAQRPGYFRGRAPSLAEPWRRLPPGCPPASARRGHLTHLSARPPC